MISKFSKWCLQIHKTILRYSFKRWFKRYKWRKMMVDRYGKDWRKTLNPIGLCVNPQDSDIDISSLYKVKTKKIICSRCKNSFTRSSNYPKRICKLCLKDVFAYFKKDDNFT